MITETAHRPWELPSIPWTIHMRWHDLLFLHWPIRSDVIRPLIPPELEIDTYDGWAWIGVVPFRMTEVFRRYTFKFPGTSVFPEINVRTYVKAPGRNGVWFFSLDASSWLAVRLARIFYGLPYYDAQIQFINNDQKIRYHSKRTHLGAKPAEFKADYRFMEEPCQNKQGSIEHWLTERYCLFSKSRRGIVGYGDIHHIPWPLRCAEAEISINTMTDGLGFSLPSTKPLMHFASELDVVAWKVMPLSHHG
jgi:uncharacterized protein